MLLDSLTLTNNNLKTNWDKLAVVFLISLVIFSASQIYETHNSTLSRYDDSIYLNVVDNLRRGNGFVIDLVFPVTQLIEQGEYTENYSYEKILEAYPSLSTPYHRAPLFFLTLAGFFEITGADSSNWVFLGSVFNVIVSSIFISLYFLLTKKYFGSTIAFISSIIIATFPIFLTHLTLSDMYPLSFLFILFSLFFIANNKKNYFLFGLVSGLAVLSNQIGILPIISYSTFLIFKKQFKGLAIIVGIWLIVVSPWMIYNFYTVQDFGTSLGIPFTDAISQSFLLINNEEVTSFSPLGWQVTIPDNAKLPFDTFYDKLFPKGFDILSITISILFFSFFTYFSLSSLKNGIHQRNNLFYLIIGLLYIIFSLFYVNYLENNQAKNTDVNYILQSSILFGVPIITGILLWLKKSTLLEKKLPRFHVLALFLSMHTLFAVLYMSITPIGIELKHLFPLFFLMLPIGLYGIAKLIPLVPPPSIFRHLVIIIIILAASPFLVFMINDILPVMRVEDTDVKCPEELCNYIRTNIERTAVIASDRPGPFFVATGNPTIALSEITPDPYFKTFIDTYDIKYVVVKSNLIFTPYGWSPSQSNVQNFQDLHGAISYETIFESSNYKIIPSSSITLACVKAYDPSIIDDIMAGLCFERIGNVEDAVNIYRNFSSKMFVESNPLLATPLLYTMGWHYNQDYEIKENLQYSNLNLPSSNVERENVVREMLSFLKKYTNEKFELAEELLEKGQEIETLDVYEEILQIDRFNLKAIGSSFTIYMRNSNPSLDPMFVKFDDELDESYNIVSSSKSC